MSDFERELRDSLAENARHAPAGDGLAERIIAEARRDAPDRRSARSRWRGWSLPVIAAACVAGVVASIIIVAGLQRPKTQSANTPSYSITPPSTSAAPPSTPAATTTAPSSSPVTSSAPSSAAPGTGPIPTSFRVADLTFVGPQDGWALGNGKCVQNASDECSALLRTSDGGRHWASVGTPPPGTDHVRFANDHTGYAYGPNALFMTSDGGDHWSQQSGGADALETLSGNVIRVRDTCGGCSPGATYSVALAEIGSTSWQSVSLPGGPVTGDSVTLSRTASSAYLAVYQNPAGGAGSARSTLFVSSDNGRHWTSRGDKCPSIGTGLENDTVALTTATDGSVTIVCAERTSNASETHTSTDGARTFSTPPQGGKFHGGDLVGAASQAVLFRAVARTDKTNEAGLYRSTDQGNSWQPVVRRAGSTFLGFENETTGRWVTDDGSTIWTTYDAGQNWQPYTFR